jgi:hypothetical protein
VQGKNLSTICSVALDGVRAVMRIPGILDGEVYLSLPSRC